MNDIYRIQVNQFLPESVPRIRIGCFQSHKLGRDHTAAD